MSTDKNVCSWDSFVWFNDMGEIEKKKLLEKGGLMQKRGVN